MTGQQPSDTNRLVARYMGWFLLLVTFGIATKTPGGFQVGYHTSFAYSTSGESRLWLASWALFFPAACLWGYGYSRSLAPALRRLWRWVENLSTRGTVFMLTGLYVIGAAIAFFGNALVLLRLPITDDENGALFGGRVLAMGSLQVPMFEPPEMVPNLFLHVKEGLYTSFDWIGPQAAWAIGELTGGGGIVFFLLAPVSCVCLALASGKWLGRPWGAVAAGIGFLSPMAFLLSLTTHAHVLSRGFLAAGICLFVFAMDRGKPILWFLYGLALGLGFLCRPPETAFLTLPFAIFMLARVFRRQPGAIAAVGFTCLGGLLPVLLFCLHSWAITGNPLLPPRFSPWAVRNAFSLPSPWDRFAANSGFNSYLLLTWFLGPAGVLLVAFGLLRDWLTKLLGWSIFSLLILGFFHNNTGIHMVGPIHYSETAIPLTLMATAGMERIHRWLREHHLPASVPASMLAVAVAYGSGMFVVFNLLAMHQQAQLQRELYSFLERESEPSRGKVIVLAPRFELIRKFVEKDRGFEIGSWVVEWQHPRPTLDDPIMILDSKLTEVPVLRQQFPDRRFFRLFSGPQPGELRLEELP